MHAQLRAACGGVFKAIALASMFAFAAAAAGQELQLTLHDVEVELFEDGRLVLHADGSSFQLAGLRALHQCEDDAGRPWACGEASRRALQGAVRGEKLDCAIIPHGTRGDRPAVECMAQTWNLNLWMVRRPEITAVVPEEWDWDGRSRYATADREGRETRALAYALAEADPLEIASRGHSPVDFLFADEPRIDDVRKADDLSEWAERRGATAEERRIASRGLVVEIDRAGVWEFGEFQVIVGEGLGGCLQYIWCRFVVVDRDGDPLGFGTSRGAPRVVSVDQFTLVWEDQGGDLQTWPR